MNKSEKGLEIEELRAKLAKAQFVATVAYSKLDAKTAVNLRKAMRDAQIDYKVVKNTLATIAAKGTSAEKLSDTFSGPVAIAIGYGESVAAAKALMAFVSKEGEKLKVKGAVAGAELFDANGVEAFSKLPGLNETRATLLALIMTPASQIARVIQKHVEASEQQAA